MSRLVILLFIISSCLVLSPFVSARELEIVGNSPSSQNSITIQSGSSININQNNQGDISTNIDAQATTGGNSASGNTGADTTIVTGDSGIDIQVKNFLNSNFIQLDCCDPTSSPSPSVPTSTPTTQITVDPTSPPSPVSNGSSRPSSSSSNSSASGTGGAPVLGLSATATPAGISHLFLPPIPVSQLTTVFNWSLAPIRISAASVGIDLPITSVPVQNGYWSVPDNAAGFGLGSAVPVARSNTVIFAHALPHLFAPLKNIKIGDKITIFTLTSEYQYAVREIRQVSPEDTSVISPTSSPTLTLYTCAGIDNAQRLVIVATPL